ncbi:probable transmembrane GTPase FZO-like, chloroplastic isoform X2 [Arabidopsis lyrata subsp. lyrata]|uniref:probable transmembrane GTPase FZO-like, chloroplastic isoform X2 n=1 Tax=Arabidopsis lyrata subsp. lyrata TaxID=81972 RepID=UPI000A29E1EB|nr:probable transmembrane GTPase FZO-like, chloroplastic isoform X2 [Arabidopsis lyrata subsp. lyrata]|eukprot:XP_020867862.1 probable transmembrane GTPase FZO-like, chloroplastic isoform X2 [Arabidopsis lyrata subsp. lyrata]
MRTLISHRQCVTSPFLISAASPPFPGRCFQLSSFTAPRHRRLPSLSIRNVSHESADQTSSSRPRTLYPGGYKRPELAVPGVLLRLDADEVMSGNREETVDLVDRALAKSVQIVVIDGGATAGKLYEAACLLKSLVKGRAYLLIAERVDIASAVGASGVALSDEGLPAIVARNTLMGSNPDSVVLPLVARIVKDVDSALSASSSEGADFLILGSGEDKQVGLLSDSLLKSVKIPIFVTCSSKREELQLLKSGASGFVISLKDLRSSRDVALRQCLDGAYVVNHETQNKNESILNDKTLVETSDLPEKNNSAGFIKLEDKQKLIIEMEKSVLGETIEIIQKAAPLMEEVSLLIDAVSRIDEPFLMVIVGEFNSGKSTVINALLGKRYLKEGVVPTTNEITFLCYSDLESEEQQRCQTHPDGQYVCYLPAPILKDINIVDTPGTNVILQRQQRLTEEFVPRADLLVFVLSADRPLTESELEEAISFVKENTRKLLNTENVILYPVSARSALEAKLSTASLVGRDDLEVSDPGSNWRVQSFNELEKFLYSFLDSSTATGMERIRLKLETPMAIAERLLASVESLVRQDCLAAREDLASADKIINRTKEYALKMEYESISWRRQALSLIDNARLQVVDLIGTTLRLSSLDLAVSYLFKGENSASIAATSKVQGEILAPALTNAKELLGKYAEWLQSNTAREGSLSLKSFENKWPTYVNSKTQLGIDTYDLLRKTDKFSLKTIQNLSAGTTSKRLEQDIREVFVVTVGGLGAAGLSASLLTSVLPTTLEDLLALGLCSAGGYVAIANFPYRRQAIIGKVNKVADALAQQLEDSMRKDLSDATDNLVNFVNIVAKPYREEAQLRLDHLLGIQKELSDIRSKLQLLQVDIDNLHVSRDEMRL